jgi:hypothetical protein
MMLVRTYDSTVDGEPYVLVNNPYTRKQIPVPMPGAASKREGHERCVIALFGNHCVLTPPATFSKNGGQTADGFLFEVRAGDVDRKDLQPGHYVFQYDGGSLKVVSPKFDTHNDAAVWLMKHQSQSVEWALANGGYEFVEIEDE